MRVEFTESARSEFLEAMGFIATQNPTAARKISSEVRKGFGQLKRFPNSGSMVPELNVPDKKQLFVKPLRLLYVVEPKIIWIVAVYHERQLISDEE